jgi:hypothetical protein
MSTFKQKIEEHFESKVIIGYGDDRLDTYEEISTADGYEVFVHMPSGSWRNVFPESDLYYYVDELADVIRNHIESGSAFYVSETIAEQLSMDDPDGDFWEAMCEDNNLIEDEDEE